MGVMVTTHKMLDAFIVPPYTHGNKAVIEIYPLGKFIVHATYPMLDELASLLTAHDSVYLLGKLGAHRAISTVESGNMFRATYHMCGELIVLGAPQTYSFGKFTVYPLLDELAPLCKFTAHDSVYLLGKPISHRTISTVESESGNVIATYHMCGEFIVLGAPLHNNAIYPLGIARDHLLGKRIAHGTIFASVLLGKFSAHGSKLFVANHHGDREVYINFAVVSREGGQAGHGPVLLHLDGHGEPGGGVLWASSAL